MAVEQNVPQIVMYGTAWCGDCKRARAFFEGNHIPYRYVDIGSDAEAAAFVMKVNRGYRSVPTIVFPDGSILVEPSARQLAQKVSGPAADRITLYKRRNCLGCPHRQKGREDEPCAACSRLVRVLDAVEVTYQVVNLDEDPQALARLTEQGIGPESLPMVTFPDGAALRRPSIAALAQKLGV